MKGIKIIKNKTIYKCKYCGKIYVLKMWAEKHHIKCRKNPKNVSVCYWCSFLENKEFEVSFSNTCSEWYGNVKSFYCPKKNIYLKPRWAGEIDTYFMDEEMPEVRKMPIKCKLSDCELYK